MQKESSNGVEIMQKIIAWVLLFLVILGFVLVCTYAWMQVVQGLK